VVFCLKWGFVFGEGCVGLWGGGGGLEARWNGRGARGREAERVRVQTLSPHVKNILV